MGFLEENNYDPTDSKNAFTVIIYIIFCKNFVSHVMNHKLLLNLREQYSRTNLDRAQMDGEPINFV